MTMCSQLLTIKRYTIYVLVSIWLSIDSEAAIEITLAGLKQPYCFCSVSLRLPPSSPPPDAGVADGLRAGVETTASVRGRNENKQRVSSNLKLVFICNVVPLHPVIAHQFTLATWETTC